MSDLTLLATDAGVQGGVVNLAGLVIGAGGILLAGLWLHSLYR
jgi:hypothetical protein